MAINSRQAARGAGIVDIPTAWIAVVVIATREVPE
jgi:hypothetical protein